MIKIDKQVPNKQKHDKQFYKVWIKHRSLL